MNRDDLVLEMQLEDSQDSWIPVRALSPQSVERTTAERMLKDECSVKRLEHGECVEVCAPPRCAPPRCALPHVPLLDKPALLDQLTIKRWRFRLTHKE